MKLLVLVIWCFQIAFADDRSDAQEVLQQRIKTESVTLDTLKESFKHNEKTYDVSDFQEESTLIIKKVFKTLDNKEQKAAISDYIKENERYLKDLKDIKPEEHAKRGYFLQNARAMYTEVYGKSGEDKFTLEVCNPGTPAIPMNDFIGQFQKLQEQKNNCSDLQKGESRKVSGVGTSYLIQKNKDGNYHALLNLDLNYLGGKITPKEMYKKLNECMAISASRLLGPDKSKFLVTILNPEEADKLPAKDKPSPQRIDLNNRHTLGHSTNYTDEMECPTLTHEILHLFGIADEYIEYGGRELDYTCRVDSTAKRIMNDVWIAWEREMPHHSRCSCDEKCKKVMAGPEHIKKLWLAESPYELGLTSFNGGCTPDNLDVKWLNTNEPHALIEATEIKDTEFSFVQRGVSVTTSGINPVSIYEKKWKCIFKPKEGLDPVLLPEEKDRFKRNMQSFFERAKSIPQASRCPFESDKLGHSNDPVDKNSSSVEGDVLTLTKAPETASLLSPDQFERLISGNCQERATLYRECSKLGYQSIKNCDKKLRASCMSSGYAQH